VDELATQADMGTGQATSRIPRTRVPTNPGLPHRRYSVPETVMRKYSLAKQRSGSSDSGVATVPVETPDSIPSNPTAQPGSSSDVPTTGTSSPDPSDDNSGKMGNRSAKGTRVPVPSESATNEPPTRPILDTVSEETSESVPGKVSEDNFESLSLESAQTTLEVSSSTPRKYSSPQNTPGSPGSEISVQGDLSQTHTVVGDNASRTIPKRGIEQSPPTTAESTEPRSSVKDDLSSSQTPGLESTDSGPSTTLNKQTRNATQSVQPRRVKDDISSSQTPGLLSTDSSSPTSVLNSETDQISRNASESVAPQRAMRDETSLTRTEQAESSDSKPQATSNEELIQGSNSDRNAEERGSSSRWDQSAPIKGTEDSHPTAEETAEHKISSRVDLSSSQTTKIASAESRSSTTLNRVSATSGMSSGNIISTPEVSSHTSTVSTDRPPLQSDRTRSSTPGGDVSFTPTECCVSTSDADRSQSLSSATDRASESCSITPVGSSVSSSSPDRPSVALRSPISSASPPSSDHTVSTQDATLSVRSDSTVVGRPAGVIRRCITPVAGHRQTRISDSEQSLGHIEFMNDTKDDGGLMLNMLSTFARSQSAGSNSPLTGDSGHATEPDSKLGEANSVIDQNNSKISDKSESSTGNIHASNKQASTSTEFAHCRHQSRPWEIIIQPTVLHSGSSKCLDDGSCETKSEPSGNKISVLSPKKQDMEFCGSKTYVVIRPGGCSTVQSGARFCGTTTYPPTKSRFSLGVQPVEPNYEVEAFNPSASSSRSEDSVPYGWSRLTDEEHTVRLQLQRHRLWMNRRMSTANAPPPSPIHGPISSCVGTGSMYRKSYDVQLVVPRYSALPRSVSMLVNTSSGECSSNSNSDSECLSLVDSLEDTPSSCIGKYKPMKHDSKPVRGDVAQLLPEEGSPKHNLHRRINAATPRGKGKAFFVSMATGLDEAGTVKAEENIDKQVVSQSMPDRLKKKLSQRHQKMEIKKKKKRLKDKERKEDTTKEKGESISPEVETSDVVTDIQTTEDNNVVTETAQTENKTQKEARATKPSVPTETPQEKSLAELPPHKRSESTATVHPVTQVNTGGGTFIVSRNDGQVQKECKSSEQSISVQVPKYSGTRHMIKKEEIPEEHSPPLKRFKASRRKTPSHKDEETPKHEGVNSRNGETTRKETRQEEQTPPLKTLDSLNDYDTVQKESKSPEEEIGAKTANCAINWYKAHEHEEESVLDVSTEVQEEVKPIKKDTSQETSSVLGEESVITKQQKSEVQELPMKAAIGSRRRMPKGHKSPKVSETKNISTSETNDSKCEGQNLPVEVSLNETGPQSEDKIKNVIKLAEIGEGIVKGSPSNDTSKSVLKPTEKLESKEPKVPQKQLENCEKLQKHNTEAQQAKATTPLAESKPTPEHVHDKKTDTVEKSPETKSLSTVSCQTSPEIKSEDEKGNTTPNEDHHDIPQSPSDPIRNLKRPQLQLKSSIPIMKSPIGTRKLSPDTAITVQQSLQNLHLPIRRPPRLLHTPPTRRSANLLGPRFHQRFEVIPEEKNGSLEYSTEDLSRLTNDRNQRPSLPARQGNMKVSIGNSLGDRSSIVSHSCLGLNQATNKYKQNRYSAPRSETSSSNHEESSNGNVRATNGDTTRQVIQRPICQSRIPRAEKMTRQLRIPEDLVCEEQEEKKDYQGKAALAPHTDDKDLLTLSKGWINFYLLKDGCSTPESSCGEGNVG